jgi:long-chain acyl-CoA synthetase
MPQSLVEAFAFQAAEHPDRLFLSANNTSMTLNYGEAQARVASAADLFRKRGVQSGDRVAIVMENRMEWVTSFLAALACGAIAVPLNTRLTSAELRSYIDDCDPRIVVIDNHDDALIDSDDHRVIICSDLPEGHGADLSLISRPDDPAVIAYTSGTTGAPKGVVLSNRSVYFSSATYAAIFNSDPDFATAIAVPLFHNTGFIDGLGHAIVAGGSVDLFRRFDSTLIAQHLSLGKYSFFIGVPTMYRRMLDHLSTETVRSSTRPMWLAYGGAPMPATVAKHLYRHLSDARLVNCYGMSEATSITHYLPAHLSYGRWDAVGIPVPGTADRITADGELEVNSPTAMLGYWKRDGSTMNPDKSDWLRTGDCAKRDEAGLIWITGRMDDLINRGGEKVTPFEVESAIFQLDGVLEVVVSGLPDSDLGQVPVALVVARDDFDIESIRTALIDEIADYKIPAHVYRVDELPRNANGKVVRSKVRQIIAERSGQGVRE